MSRRRLGLAMMLAAASLSGMACGSGEQPETASADSAFLLRLHAHQQTARELARTAERRSDNPAIRSLAQRVERRRDAMLAELGPRWERVVDDDDTADLGIDRNTAAEEIPPTAMQRVSPVDQSFVALMRAHDGGAIALLEAAGRHVERPVLRDLAQQLLVEYGREMREIETAAASIQP